MFYPVWDVRKEPKRLRTLTGHENWVRALGTIDNHLVSCGADGAIRIWQTNGDFACVCQCDAGSGRLYSMAVSDHVCFLLMICQHF